MKKKQKNSKFYKTFEDFIYCQEMRDLIKTSQIGPAAWLFLSVLTLKTINTDGILYKYDDFGKIVPLTNKDISNWFIGLTDYNEETCAMYINLLILKHLLYENQFGCLTITNYCYTDGLEPSLHSVEDPSAKLKVFGIWANDKRPLEWKQKYKKLLQNSGQQTPLAIEMDYSEYITFSELSELLNISKSTVTRYIKKFCLEYPDSIQVLSHKNRLFKKTYISSFEEMFNLEKRNENMKENCQKNAVKLCETIDETMSETIPKLFRNSSEDSEKPHNYAENESETMGETIPRKVKLRETMVKLSPIDIKDTNYYDDDNANDDDDTNANQDLLRYVYSLGFSSDPSQEDLDRLNKLLISKEYDFSTIIKKLKDINGKAYTFQYLIASLDNLKTKKINPSDPNYLGYWDNEQELNNRLEYIALSTKHPHIQYGQFDDNQEKTVVVTMLRFWTADDVKTAVDELDVYGKEINFENLDLALKHKIPYKWMIELKESQDDNRN